MADVLAPGNSLVINITPTSNVFFWQPSDNDRLEDIYRFAISDSLVEPSSFWSTDYAASRGYLRLNRLPGSRTNFLVTAERLNDRYVGYPLSYTINAAGDRSWMVVDRIELRYTTGSNKEIRIYPDTSSVNRGPNATFSAHGGYRRNHLVFVTNPGRTDSDSVVQPTLVPAVVRPFGKMLLTR